MGRFVRNFMYGLKKYLVALFIFVLIIIGFSYMVFNDVLDLEKNIKSKEQNNLHPSNTPSVNNDKMMNLCKDGCSPSTYIDYIIKENLLSCICTTEINNLNPQYDLNTESWIRKKGQ